MSPDEYPSLTDRRHWKRLGREHGRRSLHNGAGDHLAGPELRSALRKKVQQLRTDAAEDILPIDRLRAEWLEWRKALIQMTPPDPPDQRAVGREMTEADLELARLELERSGRNETLVRNVDQARATAEQADAVYRHAYQDYSRSLHPIDPLNLALPSDLAGPIPDPLETSEP